MWRLRAPLLALLLMQVILLASSGVTATKKPLGKQETCNMKNHMIEYLRNNGVQIYERPQISSASCKREWENFGTCCEPEDITTHVREKIELNNMALDAVVQEMNSLGRKLAGFRRTHSKKTMGNGISFKTASPRKSGNKEKSDKLHKQLKLESKLIGKAIIESLPLNVEHQQKCVAKINSVISKSACSICSGRSDDFFNKDGNLQVSEPLCRNVLRDCSEAWVSMVQMAANVRGFTSRIRSLNKDKDEDGMLEEKGFTMNLDSFITNRNLIPILKKCSGQSLERCSFEHVAALCEQFIHIQAPTYIESSQSQAQKILTSLKAAERVSKYQCSLMKRNMEEIESQDTRIAVTPNITLSGQRFWIGVKQLGRMKSLKNVWISIQLQLPVLNLLVKKLTKKGGMFEMSSAISKAKSLLTQIENTIAAAALNAHGVLREAVLNGAAGVSKQQAETSWSTLCSLVERIKLSSRSSRKPNALLKTLEIRAITRYQKAIKSQNKTLDWVIADKFFMKTLKLKIEGMVLQKKGEKTPRHTVDATTLIQASEVPLPPTQPRILSKSMTIDNKPDEIVVVVNKQCNPCLSPGDPDILSGP